VPACRDGIKKYSRTDVHRGFEADGDGRQNHACEQNQLVPGSEPSELLTVLVHHVTNPWKCAADSTLQSNLLQVKIGG
jgi:hypothetical protein